MVFVMCVSFLQVFAAVMVPVNGAFEDLGVLAWSRHENGHAGGESFAFELAVAFFLLGDRLQFG